MDAGVALLDLGFTPYLPLLNHFLDITHPRDYQTWLDLDLSWLEVCDVVLRLPGESVGADVEVRRAQQMGLPVFFGLEDLLRAYHRNQVAEASGFTEQAPNPPLSEPQFQSNTPPAPSVSMGTPYAFVSETWPGYKPDA
jgi:hypothetical protein